VNSTNYEALHCAIFSSLTIWNSMTDYSASNHTEHCLVWETAKKLMKVFIVCILVLVPCVRDHMKMPTNKMGKEQEKFVEDNTEEAHAAMRVACICCCFWTLHRHVRGHKLLKQLNFNTEQTDTAVNPLFRKDVQQMHYRKMNGGQSSLQKPEPASLAQI
jgi:hypothetical protein